MTSTVSSAQVTHAGQPLAAVLAELIAGGAGAIRLPFVIEGALGSSERLAQAPLPAAATFPANFAGSIAVLEQEVPPAAACVLQISYRAGGAIQPMGTLTVQADGGFAWATAAGGAVAVPAQAVPLLIGPVAAVASLTGLAILLVGTAA